MIVKRIDCYLSRAFLVRFILSLAVICGLYLSFDALQRVDQIQKLSLRRAAPKVLAYYSYLFPARILDTVPPLLLVGAGLALVQMSCNRELLTLKASGVSLQRVTLPIFFWTLLVVILVFWGRESIVPLCTRNYELIERDLDGKTDDNLVLREPGSNRKLIVGSYDYAHGTMSQVRVIDFHDLEDSKKIKIKTIIEAESGTWLSEEGRISLETVTIQHFDENGIAQGKQPLPVLPSKLVETSLVPFDFARAQREAILPSLTLSDLSRHVRSNPEVPRFRVMLHSRLAAPLMPFVMLLVGIPVLVGFHHSAESRVLAVIICALVAGGLYVLSFVFISMGNTGAIHPVLAGWLPVLLVGPAGIWLFRSMHT